MPGSDREKIEEYFANLTEADLERFKDEDGKIVLQPMLSKALGVDLKTLSQLEKTNGYGKGVLRTIFQRYGVPVYNFRRDERDKSGTLFSTQDTVDHYQSEGLLQTGRGRRRKQTPR